jgi:hypothetical protein
VYAGTERDLDMHVMPGNKSANGTNDAKIFIERVCA